MLKDGRRYPIESREKHVGLLALFSLTYFCVASGPFAIEDSVRAAGTGWTLLLLLVILPITQHLPTALVNCELASAMPENGGYIIWISRAFGNFWGFQRGWWSWVGGVVDCSLYVYLFVVYLTHFITRCFSIHLGNSVHIGMKIAAVFLVTIANLLGLQLVWVMSFMFSAVTLAPFVLICIGGLSMPEVVPMSELIELRDFNSVHWGLCLSALLWAGSGWDSPGTVAGDVKSPKTTYPRAVLLAIIAVTITNFLPVFTAMRIHKVEGDDDVSTFIPHSSWDTNNAFWALIGLEVGGYPLWVFVSVCAVITAFGLLNLLVTSSAWALYALALPGLLHIPFLTSMSEWFHTPHVCIVLNFVLLCACSIFTFERMLQVAMTLNMIGISMESCSLIWLRITEPFMKRPYKIPVETGTLCLFMLPQFALTIFLSVYIDRIAQYMVGGTIATGFLVYFFSRLTLRIQLAGRPPPNYNLPGVFQGQEASSAVDEMPGLGQRYSVAQSVLPTVLGGNADAKGSDDLDFPNASSRLIRPTADDYDNDEDDDAAHTDENDLLTVGRSPKNKRPSQHLTAATVTIASPPTTNNVHQLDDKDLQSYQRGARLHSGRDSSSDSSS